jgi:hypothetical protein
LVDWFGNNGKDKDNEHTTYILSRRAIIRLNNGEQSSSRPKVRASLVQIILQAVLNE